MPHRVLGWDHTDDLARITDGSEEPRTPEPVDHGQPGRPDVSGACFLCPTPFSSIQLAGAVLAPHCVRKTVGTIMVEALARQHTSWAMPDHPNHGKALGSIRLRPDQDGQDSVPLRPMLRWVFDLRLTVFESRLPMMVSSFALISAAGSLQ